MSAMADPQASPEWEAARMDWWKQAQGEITKLHKAVSEATPGNLSRSVVYAPVHDLAGLAGVFGYDLIGKIARSMMEALRRGPDPIDERMLTVCRAYIAALSALHAKDVRGAGGASGDAILAKLASIHP